MVIANAFPAGRVTAYPYPALGTRWFRPGSAAQRAGVVVFQRHYHVLRWGKFASNSMFPLNNNKNEETLSNVTDSTLSLINFTLVCNKLKLRLREGRRLYLISGKMKELCSFATLLLII